MSPSFDIYAHRCSSFTLKFQKKIIYFLNIWRDPVKELHSTIRWTLSFKSFLEHQNSSRKVTFKFDQWSLRILMTYNYIINACRHMYTHMHHHEKQNFLFFELFKKYFYITILHGIFKKQIKCKIWLIQRIFW